MPQDKAKNQVDKFKEAARELETDDDEARFDEKLRRIARTVPSVSPTSSRDEFDEQKD